MKKNTLKTAVITGVSSGIGLALVQCLLKENYFVIGTTKSGYLKDIQHKNLKIIALDLDSEVKRKGFAREITKEVPYIDLLINNAGIAPDVFQEKPDLASFMQTISTNLTATVFFTEQLIEKVNKNGKIIFISSDMGLMKNARKTGTAYRISKAGINMYAVILAHRLLEKNIAVGAVHPGWVRTKLGGDSATSSPEQSATAIISQLENINGAGKFYNAATSQVEIY